LTLSNKKCANNNSNESVKDTKKSELDVVIKDVKAQLRKHYAGYKEQIERIGNVLKDKKFIKEQDICTEIKEALRDEINEKIISSDTIERCCPDEWKRKTKCKEPRKLNRN
jgi:acid stress-induced BolA-like protein IbaG/YrbA